MRNHYKAISAEKGKKENEFYIWILKNNIEKFKAHVVRVTYQGFFDHYRLIKIIYSDRQVVLQRRVSDLGAEYEGLGRIISDIMVKFFKEDRRARKWNPGEPEIPKYIPRQYTPPRYSKRQPHSD